jgi:hypothetical protein
MVVMPPISVHQFQYEGRIIPEVVIINDPNAPPAIPQPVVRAPHDPWGAAVVAVKKARADYEALGYDAADQAKRLRIEQIRAGGLDAGDENEREEDNEDDEDEEVSGFYLNCCV